MKKRASIVEKGGGVFQGIKLLLCENPLPPIPEAVEAAAQELPRSNFYTEQYSQPLREAIGSYCGVTPAHVHVNAGSELILRQVMGRFGKKVHLISPTFALFEEAAAKRTHTYLREEAQFQFDMRELEIPRGTTLAIIVNPNNPNGAVMNLTDNLELLEKHPNTLFLVDEAFIELGGVPVTSLAPSYPNLMVTRTFSKAFSLAGFRVGYAVASQEITKWLNESNDAYPLARPSQAAALASLQHMHKIRERVRDLKQWTRTLALQLQSLDIKTFPSEGYFFLGKVPGMSGDTFARELQTRDILVKALHQPGIGEGFIRFTTSTPQNNAIAVKAIRDVLAAHTA